MNHVPILYTSKEDDGAREKSFFLEESTEFIFSSFMCFQGNSTHPIPTIRGNLGYMFAEQFIIPCI